MSHLWHWFRISLWNNPFSKIKHFPKLPSPLVAAVVKNAISFHPLLNIGATKPVASSAQVLDSTSHCYCPTSATLHMGSVSHIPPIPPVKDHKDEEQLDVGVSQQEMCAPASPLLCGQGIPPPPSPPPPPPLPESGAPSTEGILSCPLRSGSPLVDSDFTARLLAGRQSLKKVGDSQKRTCAPASPIPSGQVIPPPPPLPESGAPSTEGIPSCPLRSGSPLMSVNPLVDSDFTARLLASKKKLKKVGVSRQGTGAPASPIPCGQGIPPPPPPPPLQSGQGIPPPPPLPALSTPSTEGIPSCPLMSGNPLVDSDFTARLLAGKQNLKKVGVSQQRTGAPASPIPSGQVIPPPPPLPTSSTPSTEGIPSCMPRSGNPLVDSDFTARLLASKKKLKKVGDSQQGTGAPASTTPSSQGIPPPPPPPPLPISSTPSTEGIPSCPLSSGNPLVDSDFTARLLAGKQNLKKVGASHQKTDLPTSVLPTENDIPLPEESAIQQGSVMEVASGKVVGKKEQKTRKGRKKVKSTKESFASELSRVLKSRKSNKKHKA